MFGSSILDVVVGLIFFFFLLSTICSHVNEWIAALLKWRARTLEEGVRQLLGDPEGQGLSRQIYDHPLIQGLSRQKGQPSYISSRSFSTVLLDVLNKSTPPEPSAATAAAAAGDACSPAEATANKAFQDLRAAVAELPNGSTRATLLTLVDSSRNDVNRARANIEQWFDDSMDRVAGWYKRKAQLCILALSAFITVSINGDALAIAQSLWRDPVLRDSVAAASREAGKSGTLNSAEIQRAVEELHAPIGWRRPILPVREPGDPNAGQPFYSDALVLWWLASKFMGLLMTVIAVSLGAPFWFDLLNRVSNVRAVGQRPERSGGDQPSAVAIAEAVSQKDRT